MKALIYSLRALSIAGGLAFLIFLYLNLFAIVHPFPHDPYGDRAFAFWITSALLIFGSGMSWSLDANGKSR